MGGGKKKQKTKSVKDINFFVFHCLTEKRELVDIMWLKTEVNKKYKLNSTLIKKKTILYIFPKSLANIFRIKMGNILRSPQQSTS